MKKTPITTAAVCIGLGLGIAGGRWQRERCAATRSDGGRLDTRVASRGLSWSHGDSCA